MKSNPKIDSVFGTVAKADSDFVYKGVTYDIYYATNTEGWVWSRIGKYSVKTFKTKKEALEDARRDAAQFIIK